MAVSPLTTEVGATALRSDGGLPLSSTPPFACRLGARGAGLQADSSALWPAQPACAQVKKETDKACETTGQGGAVVPRGRPRRDDGEARSREGDCDLAKGEAWPSSEHRLVRVHGGACGPRGRQRMSLTGQIPDSERPGRDAACWRALDRKQTLGRLQEASLGYLVECLR